jgi:hypothetical protein
MDKVGGKVSFLFYLNGQFQDTGVVASETVKTLENAGSDDNVNVLFELGKSSGTPGPEDKKVSGSGNWSGARIYQVSKNEKKDFLHLSEYLKAEKEIPENPFLKEYIGQIYFMIGDKENAKKYFDAAADKGLLEIRKNVKGDEYEKFQTEFKKYDRQIQKIISNESELIEDLGEKAKMGDPSQLQHFIELGLEKYPAEKHVLVIMTHGQAWMSQTMDLQEMLKAIQTGVDNANNKTGRHDKIDVMVSKSCKMGSLEADFKLKGASDVLVTSENPIYFNQLNDWDVFINKTQNDQKNGIPFDSEKFGEEIVKYYKDRDELLSGELNDYESIAILGDRRSPVDLESVRCGKLDGVTESFANFLDACDKNGVTDKQLFKSVKEGIVPSCMRSGDSLDNNLRDLGSIIESIKNSPDIPESVKTEADKLEKSVEAARIEVYNKKESKQNLTGFTIWAPANLVDYQLFSGSYSEKAPEFSEKSKWKARLDRACENQPKEYLEEYKKYKTDQLNLVKNFILHKPKNGDKKDYLAEKERIRIQGEEIRKKTDFTVN